MKASALVLLLGGVAVGKSTVLRLFAEHGVVVLDADLAVHALSEPQASGWQAVYEAFGSEALLPDGTLNRAWLRAAAFSSEAVRRQLESIFHPLVDIYLQKAWSVASGPYVMIAFPLIPSSYWLMQARRIVTVDASYLLRLLRVKAHRQYSAALFCRMLRAQSSRLAYLSLADDVLFNDNSLEVLRTAVDAIHVSYVSLFSSSSQQTQ